MKLLANLGGEEGPDWRRWLEEPAVGMQAGLWHFLFGRAAGWLEPPPALPAWPELLGSRPEAPVFPWLPEDAEGVAVPWFGSADAAADAEAAGLGFASAAPEIVRAVHDKAFAHETAREERLVPPVLRGAIHVLSADALLAPDAADRIEATLANAPAFARERFTLKPRLGTSGRGRVAGRGGRLDRERLGGALERLAGRGGAVLEPWLERIEDFSVQLHVAEEGVTMLGSLVQELAPSGRYLGHRGELDSRGRIFTGRPEEEALREAAALVAVAARERGFRGPCGVDAFSFREPEADAPVLRPVVELNARFTAGLVTVGLVRRALPLLKRKLGFGPGERLGFRFRLQDEADTPAPGERLRLRFEAAGGPPASLAFGRPDALSD